MGENETEIIPHEPTPRNLNSLTAEAVFGGTPSLGRLAPSSSASLGPAHRAGPSLGEFSRSSRLRRDTVAARKSVRASNEVLADLR